MKASFFGITLMLTSLTGCSLLAPSFQGQLAVYAPARSATPSALPAAVPTVDWQLAIARPNADRLLDSPRIAVKPHANEVQVYRGAVWSMPPTDMIESSVLHALENSGKITGIARSSSGLRSDYRLVMDIRHFEADYAGQPTPTATIEVHAKLIHSASQQVVSSQTFREREIATGTPVAQVVDAFTPTLERISLSIASWSLTAGQRHHDNGRP